MGTVFKPELSHLEERIFFRWLSTPIAKFLSKTKVMPNTVSIFNFILTLIGCVFISLTAYNSLIVGVIFLYFGLVFDKVDGTLAKLKSVPAPPRIFFEGFLDKLGEIALFIAIAIATRQYLTLSYSIFIIISVAGLMMFYYHHLSAMLYFGTRPPKKISRPFILSYTRAKHFLLIIFLALINRLEFFFPIFSLLFIYSLALFFRTLILHKGAK